MKSVAIGISLLLLSGCEFRQEADQMFADQHFKTAIALVELHKVRFGEYPQSLSELKYTGDWDQIALRSVTYEKYQQGYRLNVTRGWAGKPQPQYPGEFWQGLGIIRSN